ncbi:hypothetical protein ACOME3_006404 [Neoechinorhynchus agilis]
MDKRIGDLNQSNFDKPRVRRCYSCKSSCRIPKDIQLNKNEITVSSAKKKFNWLKTVKISDIKKEIPNDLHVAESEFVKAIEDENFKLDKTKDPAIEEKELVERTVIKGSEIQERDFEKLNSIEKLSDNPDNFNEFSQLIKSISNAIWRSSSQAVRIRIFSDKATQTVQEQEIETNERSEFERRFHPFEQSRRIPDFDVRKPITEHLEIDSKSVISDSISAKSNQNVSFDNENGSVYPLTNATLPQSTNPESLSTDTVSETESSDIQTPVFSEPFTGTAAVLHELWNLKKSSLEIAQKQQSSLLIAFTLKSLCTKLKDIQQTESNEMLANLLTRLNTQYNKIQHLYHLELDPMNKTEANQRKNTSTVISLMDLTTIDQATRDRVTEKVLDYIDFNIINQNLSYNERTLLFATCALATEQIVSDFKRLAMERNLTFDYLKLLNDIHAVLEQMNN